MIVKGEWREMIKAIIFDMDGLMVDTEVISYQCYKEIIESYGFDFHKADYVKDYPGKPLRASIEFIKDKYHLDYDNQEKIEIFHQLENQYINNNGVELKKGLIELLEYLKENHYQTIVATSSHKDRAERILNQHNVLQYIDDIVCGDEVKRGKPFPDIFLKACEKLHVSHQEALVLEDSEAGIQAAYDAHIPVICIPDMKHPSDEYVKKVEHVYDSLNDIISYLKHL